MGFRTLTIGRSRSADIRIQDSTISRLHAELTLTDDKRFYLIDRQSLRGTMVRQGGQWVKHKAGYVEPNQAIMLGSREIVLAELLERRGPADHRDRRHRERGLDRAHPAAEGPGRT